MALIIFSLVKAQWAVPGPMYRASEQRNKILENEAAEQQSLLMAQSEQLTQQKVANARLEQQVSYLTEQVQTLTAEIQQLRGQVGRL